MKYRFSETEMGIGEDTLSRCSSCGQWHKGEQGFAVDVEGADSWARYKIKLCYRCAEIYIPKLEAVTQRIIDDIFRR